MKSSRLRILAGAALLLAGASFAALSPGTEVWVKAKNTKLLSKPDATSSVVKPPSPLSAGDKLLWQGAVGKEFHKVSTPKGATGYVYYANLSLKEPALEYSSTGTKVDARTFASSGAATKALSEGPIAYGSKKLSRPDAVSAVVTLEAIAAKVDVAKYAARAQAAGLAPVVSPEGGRK